jgi:Asp-tRNA(Asn)/Glu-tRNA(Gln) amidotransferase C subunit
MRLRLREDVPQAPLPVEEAVGQAPDRDGDLFRVPHILKTAAGRDEGAK